ncbi:hypothetical protein LTR64_007752 [Lithohypha guttulata]|uniref:uncharacterized protein n=1 Tax=Lithohypha guttulata TaxID=1690604 RepID=UPI002DDFE3B4|nr:hypothetical protein LTR51_007262 [Lithohypha guttulata]
MGAPGYYFRDGGTTPTDEINPNSEFRARLTRATRPPTASSRGPLGQETSTSHILATQGNVKGAVHEAGKEDHITNLGWQKNAKGVDQLVAGLDNDDLWMLIRRFNKQTFHVKAIPQAPPGGLDLNIADEDEFSPIKLRANIERLYMTVIVGLVAAFKHVVRLRSWREPRRTAGFAGVYVLAWVLNLVLPTLLTTIIVLITVPEARDFLFPPAPIALVNSKTGGVQTPKAGVLGSHDSVTGAPEKYKGEAVEQEASNLVSSVATVAISSAAGRHDQGEPDHEKSGSKKLDKHAPDPTSMATSLADASSAASGGQPDAHNDKTKQPMEDAVWAKMRPAMHIVGDIADGWERFANALSPVPPFDENKRLQLGAIFAPLLLLSLFLKAAWVVRGGWFIGGAIFFTDPLQQRGIALLNEKIPDWPKYLELRNTLLKGVPTNAQLTITLLRIGEANRAPLIPPPSSAEPPPEQPAELDKQALTENGLDASHSEIEDAITVDRPSSAEGGSAHANDAGATPKKKSGIGAKIVSAFKHTTGAGIETKLTADNARAALGSTHAKQKLGILPTKAEMQRKPKEGPVEFKGRHNGRRGAVYVDSSISPATADGHPESPCVYFSTDLDGDEIVESISPKNLKWAVPIKDIKEIKKIGGLGWKARIIVGWATDREIKDSIVITDKYGKEYKATALAERDELFNRLLAMGQQVWEAY